MWFSHLYCTQLTSDSRLNLLSLLHLYMVPIQFDLGAKKFVGSYSLADFPYPKNQNIWGILGQISKCVFHDQYVGVILLSQEFALTYMHNQTYFVIAFDLMKRILTENKVTLSNNASFK